MAAILQSLLTFLLLYKYAAVFVLTFFAAMAAPIPSGAITVAAFFFATQGYMSAPLIFLASVAGNVLGDLLTFRLTRRYGRRFMRRIGFGRLLDARVVQKLEAKIDTHPVSTVFISRLTTAVTPLVNVLVGFTKMPFRTFAAAAIAGETAETGVSFLYGTFFGNQLAYVFQVAGLAGTLILVLLVLIAVLLWKRRARRSFDGERPSL
jgi:membrane-associated protein